MLMQRAILLAPEWMGSVLYQATPVRWDLQKHKKNEFLALTNCRNTNAHAVYQSAVQIIQVPRKPYKLKADVTFWMMQLLVAQLVVWICTQQGELENRKINRQS